MVRDVAPEDAVQGVMISETKSLRRSARERKPPEWLSGEFVSQSHQVLHAGECKHQRVWEEKAEFLAKLATKDTFARVPESFCQAILKTVANE